MHILFLSDNFPPEVNAPASRTFEHCREWVKSGASVTVITCAPNFPQGKVYDGYRNRLYQVENVEGIRVVRVWSFIAPNKGFFLRTLDYLSFAAAAVIASLFEKADVIIATSPQFFCACSGWMASLLKRKPWVFEVRDLWPESIGAVGAMKRSFLLGLLERVELFLYRQATRIVVVTDSFKANISSRGVDPEKIHVVKNGVDREFFSPDKVDPELRSRLGLEGRFVVGYIGTHGMAHALDYILRCAANIQKLPEFERVHFLFVGDGAEKERLVALAKELSLSNVTFCDPVPKERVVHYLNLLDVALVNLRRSETFLNVIPSKIFEAAAVGKPILLGVDGEARRLVEAFGAGEFFVPENDESFRSAILRLSADRAYYCERGRGGGELTVKFSRAAHAERLLSMLYEIWCRPDTDEHRSAADHSGN